mgnify:CR=1 FL=1
MKASGDGILDRSVFYFHTASGFAQELLFYLDSVGHFFCDARYCVRRASHESFLLLYVHTGKCAAQYEGRSYTMQPGEALFIDCHRPHEYRAVELSEIYWVHFNGNVSRGLFEEIYSRYGAVVSPRNTGLFLSRILPILSGFQNRIPVAEPNVSCRIHCLLADLLTASFEGANGAGRTPVQTAMEYIEENFKEDLALEKIAALVSLSPYHFSRMFKQETGFSPHEYVLTVRIDAAKTLLKTTGLSIKEITYAAGFHSEAHFVSTFKKRTRLTPTAFRNTAF